MDGVGRCADDWVEETNVETSLDLQAEARPMASRESATSETSEKTSRSVRGDLRSVGSSTQETDPGELSLQRLRKLAALGDPQVQYGLACRLAAEPDAEAHRAEGIGLLRVAARRGNRDAQYELAHRYGRGGGVRKNLKTAYRYLKRAAKRGHPLAQFSMGLRFERCDERAEKDLEKAVSWHRKSAVQGVVDAQKRMARCYQDGVGVEPSYKKAANWFRRAALQGDAGAQYELGVCYEEGTGLKRNEVLAAFWYRKAAEQGLEQARVALAELASHGEREKLGLPSSACASSP